MRAFRDLKVRQKLTRVAVLASSAALLSAAAAFVAYDVVTVRAGLVRRLATDAEIVAANSVSALLFQDEKAAGTTLAALRAEPHVVAGAIYDETGRIFATYRRDDSGPVPSLPSSGGSGQGFLRDRLVLFRPVLLDQRPVGTVVIEADLGEIAHRLWRYVGIVVLVSLLSLLLALRLSQHLQEAISRPILRLAETARRVADQKDYAARVPPEGTDEVGQLVVTFNEMLARIEEREHELQDIKRGLEERVEARTQDLRRELAERRRAEAELRKSQLLLAEAERLAHVGSWEWDVGRATLTWSDEAYRIHGRDPASFVPSYERFLEAIHPQDRAGIERGIAAALEKGGPWEAEYRVVLPDGKVRHTFARAQVDRDDSGRPLRMIGTAQDVTETRAAEAEREQLIREQAARADAEAEQRRTAFLAEVGTALAASLEDRAVLSTLARLAVPAVADWCVVVVRGEGESVFPAAVQHREAELVEPLWSLVRSMPAPHVTPGGVVDVLRTGEARLFPVAPALPAGIDAERVKALQHLGFASLMLVPLQARSNILGVLVLGATGDRRFGYRDLSVAQGLADRGALAADNARLYREAQEANRMKDEFLATLSHELRTPLNAIVGWTKLLQAGGLDEAATTRAIETIDRNAHVQTQLIADILDVSRIVAGKLHLNVRTVDPRTVIEAALDSVRHAAEVKGVRLETALRDIGSLEVDADRLQQIVWNLLANGIKFTARGGWVRVRLDRDEEQAIFVVEDNGLGIASAFLPHVFERFRQADSSTTRPHGGLGLGLAIVRHLVELHGGTADVASEGEGRGARFTVRLPRAAVAVTPPAETRRPAIVALEPGAGQLAGLRVLVVEDEKDSRELIRTMLAQLGAEVVVVPSADDALSAIDRHAPDVLLSDIEMPGTDGYTLIRRLRARPAERGGTIPAAALTAYARPEDRVAALRAGYQLHLPKPVQPGELAAVVNSLANRRTQVRP